MNIYRISQEENRNYDTYDSAIVVAPDVATARRIHPQQFEGEKVHLDWHVKSGEEITDWSSSHSWCKSPDQVKVELIGVADSTFDATQVVCASFNAG